VKLTAIRIILGMVLLGVLIPLGLLGVHKLRPENPVKPPVEQRMVGELMPVLYPGVIFIAPFQMAKGHEAEANRTAVAMIAASFVANALVYALVGCLLVAARAIILRLRSSML
jgi:hypothetical protein